MAGVENMHIRCMTYAIYMHEILEPAQNLHDKECVEGNGGWMFVQIDGKIVNWTKNT
jgi:hypothetical protein